jgi:hypothetical protein
MQVAALILSFVSVGSAFVASIFWYLSARNRLPPILPYWDRTPDDNPFFVTLQTGVKLNRWAAGFAAASALCTGLATVANLHYPDVY